MAYMVPVPSTGSTDWTLERMTSAIQPLRAIFAILLLGLAAACTQPDRPQGPGDVFDPYEARNRGIHSFNVGVDRVFFRPASKGYVSIVPAPMVTSFSHFADNISEPSNMVNAILQGDGRRAGTALARFLLNSTIGFAGLADPATEFGIPADHTDFGETLHVWGAREGAYVELPFFGPSNERDAVGTLVDFFTNPISYWHHNPADNIGVYAEIVQQMGNRGRYSDTVDSILYESEDSYAQSRVIYLQNRRFELAGQGQETYSDPYDDFPADPYEDPYALSE